MIRRILVILCFVCIYQSHLSSQEDALVWFKTEPVNASIEFPNREDRDFGKWLDHSDNNIELQYIAGGIESDYVREVYSMNYNRALYFDYENISEYFFHLRSNINTTSTIMAVLVPNKRETAEQEDWSMRWNYGGPTKRVLTVDEVLEPKNQYLDHLLDYGDDGGGGVGTDQFIDEGQSGYEKEKYGRIVTYNAYLTGDRCTSSNSVLAKAFNLYSDSDVAGLLGREDGQIAELIVFKKVLTEEERFVYESYLAIKYGISKELNYLDIESNITWNSTDMAYFSHRHTGIGVYPAFGLFQSRSNSYYVEDTPDPNIATGRIQEYSHVHNYSNHPHRLLTISSEDESVPISGGSLVWGDDDLDIYPLQDVAFDESEYTRVPRNWGITKKEGEATETPSWCNFVNLDKDQTGDIQLTDMFPTASGSVPTSGHMASTTLMTIDPESSLSWTIEAHGSENGGSVIGISDDNYSFADVGGNVFSSDDGNIEGYTHFLVACISKGNEYKIVYDVHGDGKYDLNTAIQIYPNIGDIMTIQLDRTVASTTPLEPIGSLQAKILINGMIVEELIWPGGQGGAFDCWRGDNYFAKMITNDPIFQISDIQGSGFEEVHAMGSNVEFSSQQIRPILEGHVGGSIDHMVPYLIIDRSGGEQIMGGVLYNKDNTDFIKGGFGITEGPGILPNNGFYDKIEFSSVDWDSEPISIGIPNSDAFTLGFRDCSVPAEIEVDVIECCGDILDICFRVKDCPENRLMDYSIESSNEGGSMVLAEGQYTIDKDHCIGQSLDPGDYNLIVELANCQSLKFAFNVQPIDRSNLLPDEIIKIAPTEISVDIDITQYIPEWLIENEELLITWYNDDPSIPVDQRIVAVGTEFVGAREGVYRVDFSWTCSNGGSCSFEDEIVVVTCGDFIVETNLISCCRSADLDVTNLGECPITVRLNTISNGVIIESNDIVLEHGEQDQSGESGSFYCLLASGACSDFIVSYQLGISLCGDNLDDDVFEWQDINVECVELPSEILRITPCPYNIEVDYLNLGGFGFQYDWYSTSDNQPVEVNNPVFPLSHVGPGAYYVLATTSCTEDFCSEPCIVRQDFTVIDQYTLDYEIKNVCCNKADVQVGYNGMCAADIILKTTILDNEDNQIGDEIIVTQSVSAGAQTIGFDCLGATGECAVYGYKHQLIVLINEIEYPYQEFIIDCQTIPTISLLNENEYTTEQCVMGISIDEDQLISPELEGYVYNWYSVNDGFINEGPSFSGACKAGEYYVLATPCLLNENCNFETSPGYSCEIRTDFTITCNINVGYLIDNYCCQSADIKVKYAGNCNARIVLTETIEGMETFSEIEVDPGSQIAIFSCLSYSCLDMNQPQYQIEVFIGSNSAYISEIFEIPCNNDLPTHLIGPDNMDDVFSQSECHLISIDPGIVELLDQYPASITYEWIGPNFYSTLQNPNFSDCDPGTYVVKAHINCETDCDDCTIEDSFEISCTPDISIEIVNQCCSTADVEITNNSNCILYVEDPISHNVSALDPSSIIMCLPCSSLDYTINYGYEIDDLSLYENVKIDCLSDLIGADGFIAESVYNIGECPILDLPSELVNYQIIWQIYDDINTGYEDVFNFDCSIPGNYRAILRTPNCCGTRFTPCQIIDEFEIIGELECSLQLTHSAIAIRLGETSNSGMKIEFNVVSDDDRCMNYEYTIEVDGQEDRIGNGEIGSIYRELFDTPDDDLLQEYTITITGEEICNECSTSGVFSGVIEFLSGPSCLENAESATFRINEDVFPDDAGFCVIWTTRFGNEPPITTDSVELMNHMPNNRTFVIHRDDIEAGATISAEISFCGSSEIHSWEETMRISNNCPYPRIIVNEISNGPSGSKEYIELMVLGDGTCEFVDIRGYLLDDNNGDFSNPDRGTNSGTGISSGHNRFAFIDRWANVPTGSLIVIYNGNDVNSSIPSPDPEDADNDDVYVLPHTDPGLEGVSGIPSSSNDSYDVSSYNPASWSYMALSNSRDAYQVRYPSGSYCHGFAYGSAAYMSGGPDDLLVSGTGGNRVLTFKNGNVRDISNYEKKTVSASTESPGLSNTEANSYFQANQECDEDGSSSRADIIINEFSNGLALNQEFIELLVTSCDPLDMRKMILDDNNGDFSSGDLSGTGIASGHIRFKNIAEWSSIPSGALIVIYNASQKNSSIYQADDPTDSNNDLVYILSSDDPLLEGTSNRPSVSDVTYNTPDDQYGPAYWGFIILANTGDAVQLRTADGDFIHGLSYGSSGLNGGPGDLLIHPYNGGQKDFFFNSGNIWYDANYGTQIISSGFVPAPSLETPGRPNNATNAEFIDFLCFESVPDTTTETLTLQRVTPPTSTYINQNITIEVINPISAHQSVSVTIRQSKQSYLTEVWIYDVRGVQVKYHEFIDQNDPQFDLMLPQGSYFIKAMNEEGDLAIRKLIVIQ